MKEKGLTLLASVDLQPLLVGREREKSKYELQYNKRFAKFVREGNQKI